MTAALIFCMRRLLCPPARRPRATNAPTAPDRRNGTPGAPGAPARYLRRTVASAPRAGHFRPGAAVRAHRDAVSHLVRRQPRARALYPRPECTRRPVRPAGGFLPGAAPRVGGVLGRGARAGGAAAADPPVRRPGAGAARPGRRLRRGGRPPPPSLWPRDPAPPPRPHTPPPPAHA